MTEAPLSGLRVLELGTLIAGPYATRLLADMGAEVIKVESPGKPDPMRQWGAVKFEGHSLWWPVQSRGKKVVTADLRSERGQALCRALAGECHVLVENFRPGTMEKWRLGPDELLAVSPGLIYARVSGYGQTGPYASKPGFASASEAISGLRYLNGFPGEAPPRTGLSIGDSLCAMFAVIGIMAALRHKEVNGGEGQVVDAAITEACFAMLESVAPEFDKLGVIRGPQGTTVANNAPSNIYKSRDDKWMIIAANNDNLFPRLCAVMGREDLVTDERFSSHDARGTNMEALDAIIAAWAAGIDAPEIDRVLNEAGVVSAPVYTIEDVFADEHAAARGMLVPVADPSVGTVRGPGVVPKFSKTPAPTEFVSPGPPGEHNAEIYGGVLGMSDEELAQLESDGVI